MFPFQCALALGLALLVSKKFREVSIFRTMYFSPQLTSMVVISVLWTVLYNANPNTGLINSILTSLGMDPIKFLSDADTAMNSIIFMRWRARDIDDDFTGRSLGNSKGSV